MAGLLNKVVAVLLEFVLSTQFIIVMDEASREAEQVLNSFSAAVCDGRQCHTGQEREAICSPESIHGHRAGIKCMTPTAKSRFYNSRDCRI